MSDAVDKGMCCKECGSIISLNSPSPGKPRLCGTCEALAPKPKGKKPKGPWKPRKRAWPNGREYWIVTAGDGRILVSEKGLESRFSNKDIAQHWADEHNKDEPEAEAASRSKVDAG